MKFGSFPIDVAEGLILAHALKLASGSLHKGHRIDAGDIERLLSEGIEQLVGARIEPGDIGEDEAAERLARAIAPGHLRFSEASTGRVNVYSTVDGLFVASRSAVDRLNRIDPAITLACLNDHVPVRNGDMVATFKIIPLAVAGDRLDMACEVLRAMSAFEVKPFASRSVSLIATMLPLLKPTVMDKTARVLSRRLVASASKLVRETRVAHSVEPVAGALRAASRSPDTVPKLIIVFGASAVIDEEDVIPEAIRQAGGEVVQVGMPVDPGNLLVLGRIGDIPVIGAPGCARSPKENGFDWVLDRILAGEQPSAFDISGMGLGGLLMEIQARPRLREAQAQATHVGNVVTVVLAAGQARRMGEGRPHKLLAEFNGVPLIRRSVMTALSSEATAVIVVTGHRKDDIEAALSGLDILTTHNPDYASGMASSLATGFSVQQARSADGVLVMLADMPGVSSGDLDRLISAFRQSSGQSIIRAASGGKRGNPVILPKSLFDEVLRLEGDVGARHLVETSGVPVVDVDIGSAAHLDVDTPEAVIAAGGILRG
ncbi:molybdenum cofactor cytidylyltransferase [Rhizobium leguminosarum]|uniref:Molybdenum cofactor cytidylyltransferase n=1 Tax=Rhizobium leguminosarum TaxID=384 RepID=A0AAE2MKW2_RHILE|nr:MULTISPECIES: molybdopterin-binding/glycosyltransferase family 2 protein [Rhizobium]MBB4291468.1 molybdenum cofactor cytidylyltransferase [Rhizobium leguminosarum]MBB4296165.1 molybdenum cofactor cytidylyltransferase [Rhizobium leguminosarum]MBB4308576.1 molybdenum cofactor cytidylyltransferase [Rhizobium leguminosarum]MBB4416411.1 molybdenum cofactor cytidylyltransferase [Rhizobium leguminosarum]MBB4430622.1 molybdenum cofactor cytidylyltransferase [Rhizobium esperanzae]